VLLVVGQSPDNPRRQWWPLMTVYPTMLGGMSETPGFDLEWEAL
jgi:hypothetical protein